MFSINGFRRVIAAVLLGLTFTASTAAAQTVSVPFPKGFIGTVGQTSSKADNIQLFQTLGVVRGVFIQTSSTGQFGGTQGNDLSGTLRLVLSNGTTIDIPGAVNWRDAQGSTLHAFGFIPNPANPVQTITYGAGLTLTLDSNSNYGLQLVGSAKVYTQGASISGDAATNGLAAALNTYLGTVTANGPQITGPSGAAGAATSARTVNENQTAVTTMTANRTVSWSILGGTDGVRFAINPTSGVLTFIAPPNFELPTDSDTNNTYVVTVQAIDVNGYSSQQTVTVTVADLDDTAPAITGPSGGAGAAASAKSVPENQTAVHTFTANEAVTWSISGGADAARFAIVPATGVLTFAAAPDFEVPADAGTNNVYDLVITARDAANNASTQTVAITVTDLDEAAPLITGPSGAAGAAASAKSVSENQTAVHTFTANKTVTWSITGGADAARFAIVPATGVLTFVAAPDFEVPTDAGTNNVYDVVITARDVANNTSTQNVAITVTDLDDTSPLITGPSGVAGAAASAKSVPENQTAVHTFSANETVTWSITGGADAARFAIVPATGVLTFVAAPDFEAPTDAGTNNVYDVILTAMDAALNVGTQTVAVTILDLDDTAAAISGPSGGAGAAGSATSVPEGTLAVYSFTASEAVTWAIAGGSDSTNFSIDLVTGALTFSAAPDFEAPVDAGGNNVYLVIVSATDTLGNVSQQTVTITVTDLAEDTTAPAIGGPSGAAGATTTTKSVPEGTRPVHSFTADEPASWALNGGADAGLFSIDPVSGALSFIAAPNYEVPGDVDANNTYIVVVTATDLAGNVSQQTVTVTVTDLPEDTTAPLITGPSNGQGAATSVRSVNEGVTAVSTFIANEAVTWSLTAGADLAQFAIDSNTGALRFVSAPDFEAPTDADGNNTYVVVITATDGFGNESQQTLTVTVADVAEDTTPPTLTGPSGGGNAQADTVTEGQTAVYTFTADEPVTWALDGGADIALLAIDPVTGALRFLTPPDFAAPTDADGNNIYLVRVSATDAAGNLATLNMAVTVTEVADVTPPTLTGPAAVTVDENQTGASSFTADEPVTWTITGTDAARFAIDPATGVLTFVAAPDFENASDANADNVYVLTVVATDAAGNASTQPVSITVADVVEDGAAPSVSGPSGPGTNQAQTVPEGDTTVATFTSDESVTWSISGGPDAALFAFDAGTGSLRFITPPDFNAPADANGDNVYVVLLLATDAAGNTTELTLRVTVTDTGAAAIQGPSGAPGAATSSTTLTEGETVVARFTADRPLTWSLDGGVDAGRFVIDPVTGDLSFLVAPDFEAPTDANGDNVYVVIIAGTDENGAETRQTLTIRITDLIDTDEEVADARLDEVADIIVDVELNHLRAAAASRQNMVRSARDRFIDGAANRKACEDLENRLIALPRPENSLCDGLMANVPFDMDGAVAIGSGSLNFAGTFFGQTGTNDGTRRRIVSGEFAIVGDGNGIGTSDLTARVIWEHLVSDRTMLGYFVEGGVARSTVDRGFKGDVDKASLSFGTYIVAEPADNIYLDGYASLGFGRNDLALSDETLALQGQYTSRSFLIGGALSGVIERGNLEIRPELAMSYGYTDIGDIDLKATEAGQTEELTAAIGGVNYADIRFTPEMLIKLRNGWADGRLTIAPSLVCEWADDDQNCGAGLRFGLGGQSSDGLMRFNMQIDADRIGDVNRVSLSLDWERRF